MDLLLLHGFIIIKVNFLLLVRRYKINIRFIF